MHDVHSKIEHDEIRDPNDFLSEQFKIHSEIFNLPMKEDYIELSSGVNFLPIPVIWRETMKKEIDEGFLYQQYTSLYGFQTVKYAVKLYERFLYSQGDIFLKADLDICMTVGASQAADLALAYLQSIGRKRILLVGMTYPLYVTLGKCYGFEIRESRSALQGRDIPTVEELVHDIEKYESDVIVFSYPSNPSGERYTNDELDRIMGMLREKRLHCIFDCVCNIIMSEDKVIVPEAHILEHKMQENCIIVNSLSKTEGVPGLRIGYLAGDYDLMQFIRLKQVAIMNPPNIPAIAVWFTMLFRCLHMSEQFGQSEKEQLRIIRCYKKMFFATTPLCSREIRSYVKKLTEERLVKEYLKYKEERVSQERVFHINKTYLEERLDPFIEDMTQMDAGFNYLIKLRPCHNISELDFCREVLEKTRIAVFTESGFTIKDVEKDNYWIRISLAIQTEQFQYAIDRLYVYLSELNSR